MEVTSDLPTPPLPLTTPIRCLTELRSLGFSNISSRLLGLESHAAEQVEQSCVQVSMLSVVSVMTDILSFVMF
jgi:hypothetical protein